MNFLLLLFSFSLVVKAPRVRWCESLVNVGTHPVAELIYMKDRRAGRLYSLGFKPWYAHTYRLSVTLPVHLGFVHSSTPDCLKRTKALWDAMLLQRAFRNITLQNTVFIWRQRNILQNRLEIYQWFWGLEHSLAEYKEHEWILHKWLHPQGFQHLYDHLRLLC